MTTGHGLQASQGVTWDSLQSGHALVEGREAAGRVAESPGIVDSRGKTPELLLPGCFGYKACRWTLVAFCLPRYQHILMMRLLDLSQPLQEACPQLGFSAISAHS